MFNLKNALTVTYSLIEMAMKLSNSPFMIPDSNKRQIIATKETLNCIILSESWKTWKSLLCRICLTLCICSHLLSINDQVSSLLNSSPRPHTHPPWDHILPPIVSKHFLAATKSWLRAVF